MDKNQEMFEKLICGLRNIYGNLLVSILLYGSFARSAQTNESDIDIAILLRGKETKEMHGRMVDLAVDLDLEYDQVFSVVNIDYHTFLEWQNILPFYRNVKMEGIVLWAA